MALNRDLPHSRFYTPRVEGEYEVRIPSDVLGKSLLEAREAEGSLAYRRRMEFMPETPGYKADQLVMRYQQERMLDELVDLRIEAALVRRRYPHAVAAAMIGTVSSAIAESKDKGFIGTVVTSPIAAAQLIYDLGRNSVDAIGGVNDAHQQMKRDYYRKVADYIKLQSNIMKSERRHWISWEASDIDRAYLSTNRIEWFTQGDALFSIHLDVNQYVAEMQRSKAEGRARVQGRIERRAIDIASPFIDGVFSKVVPSGYKQS